MIANNLTILAYNKIASIGIIPTCPFLGRRHAERSIKEKDFHFVDIKLLHILAIKFKWVMFGYFCNTFIDGRLGIW